MTIIKSSPLEVSGSRFRVLYQIQGNESTAYSRAKDICVEQTIEYPEDLIPDGGIREHVLGQIESFELKGKNKYESVISFADEISGFEFPQLLNVIFGNISMKPGIRVQRLFLSENILKYYRGPQYGISGIRKIIGIENRPLLATAIKPMGLNAKEFSLMAKSLALGGIDIIKDDHGLANQAFAPFKERVLRVADAVQNVNEKTGRKTLYMPNVTGPFEEIMERIFFAKQAGATGLLLLPGYCGFDFIRYISEKDDIGLPIISHPAFLGSYGLGANFGISYLVLYGQISRLAGIDISIFPNYIGRFSYSKNSCRIIVEGCKTPMGHIKKIFPAAGGGISPDSFMDLNQFYGEDITFLIGGNLHRQSDDLKENVQKLSESLMLLNQKRNKVNLPVN